MIGSLNAQDKQVTIVGAGIAGLLASYYLDKAGYEVTLIEAKAKAGGLISTQKTPWGIAEQAAHSFLATPQVLKLCHELGVELLEAKTRTRYILRNGKLRQFPLNLFETIETFYRACFVPAISQDSQTMQQWASRHLGKAATDYLISSFLTGIYAASPNEILVEAAFPHLKMKPPHTLFTWWFTHIRRLRPTSTMMAPKGGMSDLIEKLNFHLEKKLGKRFIKSTETTSLPNTSNVILCTQAFQAAKLLTTADPLLSHHLSHLKYTSLISVTVFLEKNSFPKEPKGIGVLIPPQETRSCLGVLFNSSTFDHRVIDTKNMVSMTCMLHATDEPIEKLIFEELKKIFHIKKQPTHIEIHRRLKAIPLYSLHLEKTLEIAKQGWCAKPGRLLFGNYTGPISIRRMVENIDSIKLFQ